ncbi:MAG: hemolysin III family protein, partial [Oscillospiraceae bacterium]
VNTDATRLLRLRKLDHAMIYVLIAGTYTPIALCFMGKMHGIIFTIVIWSIALLGIVTKLLWFNAPRWLYTSLYLLMGWAIIFDIKVFNGMAAGCIALIAAGGISYSIGAICYICKKPNIGKWFGFHEIFHLFIMLGTLLHFCAVIFYIV